MKLCYANKYLTENIMLYPMKGFYLLSLPITECHDNYQKAAIGKERITLIGDEHVLVVKLNPKVVAILHEQIALSKDHPNTVLGVLLNKDVDEAFIGDVNFVGYYEADEALSYLSEEQLINFNEHKQEEMQSE